MSQTLRTSACMISWGFSTINHYQDEQDEKWVKRSCLTLHVWYVFSGSNFTDQTYLLWTPSERFHLLFENYFHKEKKCYCTSFLDNYTLILLDWIKCWAMLFTMISQKNQACLRNRFTTSWSAFPGRNMLIRFFASSSWTVLGCLAVEEQDSVMKTYWNTGE